MRGLMTIMLGTLALGACGGGSAVDASEETSTADSSGDEAATEETEGGALDESGDEGETTAPARSSGPGRLTVAVRVRGESAVATVEVRGADGEVAASGQGGETFTVPAGTYQVSAAITDAAVMVDTPTRVHEDPVDVEAGAEATVTVDMPVARVRLNVLRAGRPVSGWQATISRQGASRAEPIVIQATNEYLQITPGRYDAVLRSGGHDITVSGLIFQGGATQTVPVNVN